MILASLVCMLLPAIGPCPAYVDYVPTVAQLVRGESLYNGKTVRVAGRVKQLTQWRSRAGKYVYQAFFICNGKCVHVFLESTLPVRNDELVSVRGPYYREYRSGRARTHNEIEASEVLPAE